MAKRKLKLKRKPNCMIIIEKLKTRVFRYVRPQFIPKDSFEKEYKHLDLHILGLDLDGKLWPIMRPAVDSGRAPTDLYMAKHCASEVNEVYGMSMSLGNKIAIGLLVGFGIAILIVIFLLMNTIGAG